MGSRCKKGSREKIEKRLAIVTALGSIICESNRQRRAHGQGGGRDGFTHPRGRKLSAQRLRKPTASLGPRGRRVHGQLAFYSPSPVPI